MVGAHPERARDTHEREQAAAHEGPDQVAAHAEGEGETEVCGRHAEHAEQHQRRARYEREEAAIRRAADQRVGQELGRAQHMRVVGRQGPRPQRGRIAVPVGLDRLRQDQRQQQRGEQCEHHESGTMAEPHFQEAAENRSGDGADREDGGRLRQRLRADLRRVHVAHDGARDHDRGAAADRLQRARRDQQADRRRQRARDARRDVEAQPSGEDRIAPVPVRQRAGDELHQAEGRHPHGQRELDGLDGRRERGRETRQRCEIEIRRDRLQHQAAADQRHQHPVAEAVRQAGNGR